MIEVQLGYTFYFAHIVYISNKKPYCLESVYLIGK